MHPFCVAQAGHTRPPRAPFWRVVLFLLVLCILLALSITPQVQAASLGKQPSHKLTQQQIQAIQQQLKKHIHVTHTGRPLTPTGVRNTPQGTQRLRPLASGLPAYNNIGISDATTRTLASFDPGNHSYSAQALQDVGLVPGIAITSQNVTFLWPSVPTAQADNYLVNGQSIVIPATSTPGAATLGVLGAADNGAASGTVTLTYTDGTTSTFTLTFPDWWNGALQTGDAVAVQMSTINTKHGTKSGTFDVFSFVTSLNTSKTLQSVTLPTSSAGGHLHVFAVGVGGPAFNNIGISDNSNPGSGNFDGGGNSYSAQALAGADLVPGKQFDADGIAYTWPTAASGTVDNYQASGQVLPMIPAPNATMLGFLGSAIGGNTSGTATITYTDGSTQTFTLGLTNWSTNTPAFGNVIVASFSSANHAGGGNGVANYLFTTETTVQTGKTIQSVTLPSTVTGGALHVFAVGTRSAMNNLGTSNNGQPGGGNYDGANHTSYTIQALEAAGIQQGQPFTFNGVTFTWPASYGQFADNYQAAGQVLPVTPVSNATMLGIVGSANFGASSGTATLTYTDGTTSTFTLGFTDWFTTTPSFGNLVVASFTSINGPSGSSTGSFGLFYAETALAPGKTLKSVTLPATTSPGVLHVFAVGTHTQYNNTGISDNSAPTSANFDGNGASYSAQDIADPNVAGWNPGDTLTYEGINYIWPGVPAGQADNYQAAGQTLPVNPVARATTLGFVGAAIGLPNGVSGTATLTYTDGSTQPFSLAFADWRLASGSPPAGNRLFAILPHWNGPQGTQTGSVYLFETEVLLTAGKTLQSVTLPPAITGGALHIFMMGTRAGENYPNNVGTSDDSDTVFANLDGAGRSYSIEALETAGLSEGQPFTFNGATFNWPASFSVIPDNYQAAGQIIPITPVTGATTLAFLGAETNGGTIADSGTATITYTDESTQIFTLTMTDWWNAAAQSGDQIAATCTYINTSTGQQTQTVHVYYTSVALQTGKTIQSVTLPTTVSSGQMHVFAISTK